MQEAASIVDVKTWPVQFDTDDLPKRKLQAVYRAPTPEMVCFLDFSVSTTGMLAGVKVGLTDQSCILRSNHLTTNIFYSYSSMTSWLWCKNVLLFRSLVRAVIWKVKA